VAPVQILAIMTSSDMGGQAVLAGRAGQRPVPEPGPPCTRLPPVTT